MKPFRALPAILFFIFTVPASAQTYCRASSGSYDLGRPYSVTMRTVVATVKRPSRYPGHNPSEWCNYTFNSMNPFYRPMQLITRPGHGQIAHGRYSIRYRSNRTGPDTFTFRLHQSDRRTNQSYATPVTVNVEVVPAPF